MHQEPSFLLRKKTPAWIFLEIGLEHPFQIFISSSGFWRNKCFLITYIHSIFVNTIVNFVDFEIEMMNRY